MSSTASCSAPRTLVVVPAWNEAAIIAATLREIRAAVAHDIVVIDDGSTDATAALAEAEGVPVIRLRLNLGVGAALRTGFAYALERGYDRAIQVDADGQHDPAHIDAVLAGLEHADIAIGSRFAGVGNYAAHGPRRWAMRVLSAAFTRAAGTPLTDVTSGFRAANRRAIRQYSRHFPAEYLGDTVDSLMTAIRAGLTVTQVPVAMRERQGGQPSNGPWKSALYLARSVFALVLAMTRRPEGRRS